MSWPAFSNPLMLAALAAAGLPVLVHLLTRARPRAVAFPPFRFLVEACAGQQSVHRLRTIVLLALRCLAMAALALLFARPFLKPAGAAAGAQASQRVVIDLRRHAGFRAYHDAGFDQSVTLVVPTISVYIIFNSAITDSSVFPISF